MAFVLFVDDDRDLLELIRSIGFPGHQIATAGDGMTALRVFHQIQVDLLVTDLGLPHLDGESLVKTLRSLGFEVPVLLMSSRPDVVERARALGARGSLQKPFRPARLRHKLQEVLDLAA